MGRTDRMRRGGGDRAPGAVAPRGVWARVRRHHGYLATSWAVSPATSIAVTITSGGGILMTHSIIGPDAVSREPRPRTLSATIQRNGRGGNSGGRGQSGATTYTFVFEAGS